MYEAGRTIQVAREMKNYKIGVLGLSETRRLQTVQVTVIRRVAVVLRTQGGWSPPH